MYKHVSARCHCIIIITITITIAITITVTKKKKRLPGELSNDKIEEDPISRYRQEMFIYTIDTAIMSIRDRFSSHKAKAETSFGPSDDINWENFIAGLKVLSTFNPQSAFLELYTVYKILVTLPIGSTKCERTLNLLRTASNQQWDRSDYIH